MTNDTNFTVSVKGDFTGSTWTGLFGLKTRLTYRETLKQDVIRRELLGPDPSDMASDEAKGIANVFSFLGVYITKAPSWWTDSNGGLDLEDNNVATEVYQQAVKKLAEVIKARSDEAEEAKKALLAVKSE